MLSMQRRLAETEGIFAELSSVISLCTAKRLVSEGEIRADETVVAFLTSSGLKDPETTARHLPPIPLVEPDLASVAGALRDSYGLEAVLPPHRRRDQVASAVAGSTARSQVSTSSSSVRTGP
jgi:threonine synthase